MAEKLKRFSANTQEALKQLACLGRISKVNPAQEKQANSFFDKGKDWLGDLDSNQDSQIQSQETESNQPPRQAIENMR